MARFNKPQGPVKIQALRYYSDAIAYAASSKLSLFSNHSSSTLNDLNSTGGRLPKKATGFITDLFIFADYTPSGTAADAAVNAREMHNILMTTKVTLFVALTDICSGRAIHFPHPPTWTQGSLTEATASLKCFVYTQNGGYKLPFIPHPVTTDDQIEVVLNTPATTFSNTAMNLGATIQVSETTKGV